MFSLFTNPRVRAAAATIAAIGMITVAGLVTAAPTYAQGPTTTPTVRGDARKTARDTAREKQFKREQTMFADQTKRLTDANMVATKTQAYITAQNALGKNTSALAAALAAFKTQIATAQTAHDAAGALITAHAGFDANGVVTDPAQAAQTVVAVRKPLMDAHVALRQGAADLRAAIRTYREANGTK